MVLALRPFVDMVWAALASSARLPLDLVHRRHFLVALWLFSRLSSPCRPGRSLVGSEENCLDKDVCFFFGFCWCRFDSFKPVAWCASPHTRKDLREFRASVGSSKPNTTWEALAFFVAVRPWLPGTWVLARAVFDSLSALRSMVWLSNKFADPAFIFVWELVLDVFLGSYTACARHVTARVPSAAVED